jgi:hypothetical protein
MTMGDNEAEITDIGKFSSIPFIVMSIIFPVTLIAVLLMPGFLEPSNYGIIIVLVAVALGFVGLMVFLLYYLKSRHSPTHISIGDKGIKIIAPKSHPFEIDWSEFDNMYIRVKGIPTQWDGLIEALSVVGAFAPTLTTPVYTQSRWRSLRIHFKSAESKRPLKKLDLRLFHDEIVLKVLTRITDYALKLHKEVTMHAGTQKFYSK